MPNGREGCEFGRILEREVDGLKEDVADIIDKLQNRPSWPVAILIIALTNLCVGLIVASL